MKKATFITYIVFIHLIAGAIIVKSDILPKTMSFLGIQRHGDVASTVFYKKTLNYQLAADDNVPEGAVIFIGNSITQGMSTAAVAPFTVNYGIGGDTASGVLKRLPYYHSLNRARAIVVSIGLNDLLLDGQDYVQDNLAKIAKALPAQVPVIFSAILPVDEDVDKRLTGLNGRIVQVNKYLFKLCAADSHLYYLDARSGLIDARGNLDDRFHRGDGVHLNTKGYAILIGKMQEAVAGMQRG